MSSHIMYDTRSLSKDLVKKIIQDAFDKKYKWWIDILTGFKREMINMNYKEYLDLLDKTKYYYFTVIKRKNMITKDYYGEIAINITITKKYELVGDYFLWILVNLKDFYEITEKYNLKPRTV